MQEMLLVGSNPRRKRRKGRRKGKRRMSALQRRYFGKRRSAPVVRRRRRSRRRVAALAAPRVHRRRSHRRSRRMRVSRVRRNPIRLGGFNFGSFMRNNLMPAGIGAIGAIGVDIALAYATPMLPAVLQSGLPRTAVKIAGAVVVGMAAGKVMGRKFGEDVTAGAITVTLYDLIKSYVAQAMPGLPLSEYNMGWASPAPNVGSDLGMYVGTDPIGSALPGLGMYVGEMEPGGDYSYA